MLSKVTAKNVGDVFLRHTVVAQQKYDVFYADIDTTRDATWTVCSDLL